MPRYGRFSVRKEQIYKLGGPSGPPRGSAGRLGGSKGSEDLRWALCYHRDGTSLRENVLEKKTGAKGEGCPAPGPPGETL